MSPATATARRAPAARPAPPAQHRQRRARLRVVGQRSRARAPRPIAKFLAIAIFCLSLLVVVVGHSMLAQGQLRMGHISAELSQEQAVNRVTVLDVAALETPARISQEASAQHLVQPTEILQLPSVPLDKPLAPIAVSPAASTK